MTTAVTRQPRRRRRQQQQASCAAPHPPPLPLPLTLMLLLLGCCAHRVAGVGPKKQLRAPLTPVKVAFLTDCQMYSNWQSLAMIYSFKQSGQPGTLTRVMCCSEETAATYPKELLDEVETHIAPSYTVDAVTHDNYAAYNKPGAVIDWLDHTMPEEEWVLVLDSDMILRRPFLVEVMQPQKGLAIGARYTYMIGVNNELAMRHVPEVVPRNDTLAGPSGRRGDQVGGFFFYQRDDLKRMSHNWLKYTEDVRQDPMAYKYSGDVYAIHPGDKPWISEMYGYSYGAAKADVWHKWDTHSMIYPQYIPSGVPRLMHYGLLYEAQGYKFDKHWHYGFDVMKCPPWSVGESTRRAAGLFPHVPKVADLNKDDLSMGEYYRDVLSLETVATMNAGFCDFHVRNCPPSQQLLDECTKALQLYQEYRAEAARMEAKIGCQDRNDRCPEWAATNECVHNRDFMEDTCGLSCDVCTTDEGIEGLAPANHDLPKALKRIYEELHPEVHDPDQKQQLQQADDAKLDAAAPTGGGGDGHTVDWEAAAAAPRKALGEAQQALAAGGGGGGAKSSRTINELVVRCYRLPLELAAVKECVAQAKEGVEYRQGAAAADAAKRLLAEHVGGDGAAAGGDGVSHDTGGVGADDQGAGGGDGGIGGTGVVWQSVLFIVLAVVVVVVVYPRLRARRRAKPGRRTL